MRKTSTIASFLVMAFMGSMAYGDVYDGRPDVVWGDTDAGRYWFDNDGDVGKSDIWEDEAGDFLRKRQLIIWGLEGDDFIWQLEADDFLHEGKSDIWEL